MNLVVEVNCLLNLRLIHCKSFKSCLVRIWFGIKLFARVEKLVGKLDIISIEVE